VVSIAPLSPWAYSPRPGPNPNPNPIPLTPTRGPLASCVTYYFYYLLLTTYNQGATCVVCDLCDRSLPPGMPALTNPTVLSNPTVL